MNKVSNVIDQSNYGNSIIATHASDISGPPDYLIKYLTGRTNYLFIIRFPLSPNDNTRSSYKVLKDGVIIEELKNKFQFKPFILNYIKDIFFTIFWGIKLKRKYKVDINSFIGCNNLLTLGGIILSKLIKIKKIIFYTIDYSDKRFTNKYINNLYLFIDKIAAQNADRVLSNTNRTRLVRKTQLVRDENNILAPNGVSIEDIKIFDKKNKKGDILKVIYHGYLAESKGVQNFIKALDNIKDRNISLDIIGYGPFESFLKEIASKSDFRNNIRFLGKKTNREILNLLGGYDLCINLISQKEDYLRYCDPMKVKEAMGCRVPLMLSDLPEISKRIKEEELGIVIEDPDNIRELTNAINLLLSDIEILNKYRSNLKLIKDELNWENIYNKALKDI